MSDIRVLGICGSLRKGSYNRMLMQVAREELAEGMRLDTADIGTLPLYDGDIEAAGMPEAAKRLKDQILAADALLIVTPEYNYSLPGVLKNAIDWASRPSGDNSFKGKPLAIMGASMSLFGTARAQYHLRQIAVTLDMHPINKPEIMLGQAQNKFDAQGKLSDPATRELVHKAMVALGEWTRRLQVA